MHFSIFQHILETKQCPFLSKALFQQKMSVCGVEYWWVDNHDYENLDCMNLDWDNFNWVLRDPRPQEPLLRKPQMRETWPRLMEPQLNEAQPRVRDRLLRRSLLYCSALESKGRRWGVCCSMYGVYCTGLCLNKGVASDRVEVLVFENTVLTVFLWVKPAAAIFQ